MSLILFHCEGIDFTLTNQQEVIAWVKSVIAQSHKELVELNYIFCSDEYLLEINKEHLDHDFFTDIITFDNSEQADAIEGDIFISIERVKENASKLGVEFRDELHRVIIHGVLHLIGHDDKTAAEKFEMRKIEDHYLALRQF